MAEETAIKILYKGVALVYCECGNCKQPFQYMADRPYTVCQFCGARIINTEDDK